jgi:dCTP deaminase
MILSDREILAAVQRGDITITPLPEFRSKSWTSTALDLTLDTEIRRWNKMDGAGQFTPISPMSPEFNTDELIARYTTCEDCSRNQVIIGRNELLLGWTMEKIKLPHTSKIAARIEGKSSLARIGLGIHVTAPTIHAGFGVNPDHPRYAGSPIRLEIWNAGPLEIVLSKGMRICQLIFEEVHGTPDEAYSGRYSVQGPSPSRRKTTTRSARRAKK